MVEWFHYSWNARKGVLIVSLIIFISRTDTLNQENWNIYICTRACKTHVSERIYKLVTWWHAVIWMFCIFATLEKRMVNHVMKRNKHIYNVFIMLKLKYERYLNVLLTCMKHKLITKRLTCIIKQQWSNDSQESYP